jgi:hypothetical protein
MTALLAVSATTGRELGGHGLDAPALGSHVAWRRDEYAHYALVTGDVHSPLPLRLRLGKLIKQGAFQVRNGVKSSRYCDPCRCGTIDLFRFFQQRGF